MAYPRTLEGRKKNAEYQAKWYKANKATHIARVRKNKKEYEKENKAYIGELKKQPCKDCGQTYPPICMDFDHLKDKRFEISRSLRRHPSSVKEEISKCELVCSNCHRIRTHQRMSSTF